MASDLTEQERQAIQGVSTAWNRRPGVTDRADDVLLLVERVVEAAPRLLPILAAHASPAAKREALRVLIGEPDLFWSEHNHECGMPSVAEADKAMAERKASLLAPEPPAPEAP